MRTLYECTDCRFCASFDQGARIFCANPALPPRAADGFLPVGEDSADNCSEFTPGEPHEFTAQELEAANNNRLRCGDEYDWIRNWIERRLK